MQISAAIEFETEVEQPNIFKHGIMSCLFTCANQLLVDIGLVYMTLQRK